MTEERLSYVYVIYRADGSPCYVGKGTGDRCYQHRQKSHNRYLARIIKKDGGEIRIVKAIENLTHQEAFDAEIALIAAIGRKARGGPLVNQTDGGDGVVGYKRTPEQCAALSRAGKGKIITPETRAKISAAHKGKPKTKEHGAAVSAAKRGKPAGPMPQHQREAIGNAHRGRKRSDAECAAVKAAHDAMTPEARALKSQRVSAALTGKPLSPEHRQKISRDQRGRVRSPEFRAKVSAAMKARYAARRAEGFKR